MRRHIVGVTAMVAVMLGGCFGSAPKPEPAVRIVTRDVPVAVPCDPKLGPRPDYPDTNEALSAAPDIFAGVQLLLAGRLLRMGREAELEAARNGCRG